MSFIKRMIAMFSDISPEPHSLDIPPSVKLPPVEPKPQVGTTIEDAERKHGKPFKAQGMVGRLTPPSRDLVDLNEKSAAEKARRRTIVVTDIGSRRKS